MGASIYLMRIIMILQCTSVDLSYASFDEVKPFIVFLATQICELDNAVQRFHRKKELKKWAWLCKIAKFPRHT